MPPASGRPGKSSRVNRRPPTREAPSRTATRAPADPKVLAAAKPLKPAPITTASSTGSLGAFAGLIEAAPTLALPAARKRRRDSVIPPPPGRTSALQEGRSLSAIRWRHFVGRDQRKPTHG